MPTPRKFFEDFVVRSFKEFRAKPHEEYLAKIAAGHANVMAERMWYHYKDRDPARVFGARNAGDYREAVVKNECDDFGIVRDVAEGFKHVQLRRATRRVTSADQAGARKVVWTNTSGQEVTWVNDKGEAISWVGSVIVELDDGSERPLLPMLDAVVMMWDRLSAKL